MSNLLKMFRLKKVDKENESPIEEEPKAIGRNGSVYNSTRRDRRSSVAFGFDDTFAKPSAPYHTVTQPKQTKGSRSCIGRDEYERYVQPRPGTFRDYGAYKKGSSLSRPRYYESKIESELPSMKSPNYDDELLDSDDSFASEEERRAVRYRSEVRDLKEENEYLKYKLRREVKKKLYYKEQLICEKRNMQKVSSRHQMLQYDLNVYKAKIVNLEKQLNAASARARPRTLGSSTFTTTSSTSNGHSSADGASGAGEKLCSASESTLPIQSAFDNVPDSIDEVKNFRRDDVTLSIEVDRAELETGIEKIDLDSTLLNDTSTEHSSDAHEHASKGSISNNRRIIVPRPPILRRSLSDTDLKKKRRSVAFKMTNL